MPIIYLAKELYDELIRKGEEPGAFVEQAVKEKLDKGK